MFEFRPNTFQFDLPDKQEYQDSAVLIQRTVNLFNTSRWKAIIEETKNFLFRLNRSLLDLSQVPTHQIRSRHHGGIKYDTLYYLAHYEMRTDKQVTYSAEAVTADLLNYLKHLTLKSRCFSQRIQTLVRKTQLFVFCYNQHQLRKRLYPKYSFHLATSYPSCLVTPNRYYDFCLYSTIVKLPHDHLLRLLQFTPRRHLQCKLSRHPIRISHRKRQ